MGLKSICSKAELAVALNLSRGRISQLVKLGLPIRPDGRVIRDRAVQWYRDNIVPHNIEPQPGAPPAARPAVSSAQTSVIPAAPAALPAESQNLSSYRLGLDQGSMLLGFHASSTLVEAFGQACSGDGFLAAMNQNPRLGYRVFPAGAAIALATRCYAKELAWARELGQAEIPEMDFGVFGPDAEQARQIVSQAAATCEIDPWPDPRQYCEVCPGAFERGWRTGAAVVAWKLCANISKYFLEFSCGKMPADAEGAALTLWHKCYPISLFNVVVRGWCEELVVRAQQTMALPRLPELDFAKLFGSEAAAAREAFEGFRVDLMAD